MPSARRKYPALLPNDELLCVENSPTVRCVGSRGRALSSDVENTNTQWENVQQSSATTTRRASASALVNISLWKPQQKAAGAQSAVEKAANWDIFRHTIEFLQSLAPPLLLIFPEDLKTLAPPALLQLLCVRRAHDAYSARTGRQQYNKFADEWEGGRNFYKNQICICNSAGRALMAWIHLLSSWRLLRSRECSFVWIFTLQTKFTCSFNIYLLSWKNISNKLWIANMDAKFLLHLGSQFKF
jgi:hypothetical protein